MSLLKVSIMCDNRMRMNDAAMADPRAVRRFGRGLDGEGASKGGTLLAEGGGAAPLAKGFKYGAKEAKPRYGAVGLVPALPLGGDHQSKLGMGLTFGEKPDLHFVPVESPKSPTSNQGVPRVASLPLLQKRKSKEPKIREPKFTEPCMPCTGNASLDRVLSKLNKPRLREALERLVTEVSKVKAKNPALTLFRELNVSGDGFLTREEMSSGMRKLGVTLLPVELEAIMRAFDIDGSTTVDCEEFTEVLRAYQESFPRTSSEQRRASDEPFPVGAPVRALFKLPNMSSCEGTVVAKGSLPGSYEVLFQGAERPAIVRASQIRCR